MIMAGVTDHEESGETVKVRDEAVYKVVDSFGQYTMDETAFKDSDDILLVNTLPAKSFNIFLSNPMIKQNLFMKNHERYFFC